jgi:hypothetical protein
MAVTSIPTTAKGSPISHSAGATLFLPANLPHNRRVLAYLILLLLRHADDQGVDWFDAERAVSKQRRISAGESMRRPLPASIEPYAGTGGP